MDRKTATAIGDAARLIADYTGMTRADLALLLEMHGMDTPAPDFRAFLDAVRRGGTPTLATRLLLYGDLSKLSVDADIHTVRSKQWTAPRINSEERKTIKQGDVDRKCEVCAGHLSVCPLHTANWRLCPHAL